MPSAASRPAPWPNRPSSPSWVHTSPARCPSSWWPATTCRAAPVQSADAGQRRQFRPVLKGAGPDRGRIPSLAPRRGRAQAAQPDGSAAGGAERRALADGSRGGRRACPLGRKADGEHTFASNDRRRAAQRIASSRAAAFILAHSTLTPPPAEATVLKAENR